MTKKIVKSLIIVFMLLLVAICFCGCVSVQATMKTNDDGTIDECVYFSLDVEKVVEAGYDVNQMKDDIYLTSLSQAQFYVDDLNDKVRNDLLLVNDEESVNVLNDYLNGIKVIYTQWTNNNFMVGIRFESIDVYKYYYNFPKDFKSEPVIEEGYLYNKVIYYGNTMFLKHNALYVSLKNHYSMEYPDLVESETNQLLYTYETDMRREHSDADYVVYDSGKYYHTWVLDESEVDKTIILYYNIANQENWILLSLGVTGGATIILLIIGIIIKKLKNNKKFNKNKLKINK